MGGGSLLLQVVVDVSTQQSVTMVTDVSDDDMVVHGSTLRECVVAYCVSTEAGGGVSGGVVQTCGNKM